MFSDKKDQDESKGFCCLVARDADPDWIRSVLELAVTLEKQK